MAKRACRATVALGGGGRAHWRRDARTWRGPVGDRRRRGAGDWAVFSPMSKRQPWTASVGTSPPCVGAHSIS